MIQNLWTPEYQRLIEMLKEDIMAGHTLERPDPPQRFYINTDWYKNVMGVVLLQ